jgi:hypothetical protein
MNEKPKITWRELKAQGIRRCCAQLYSRETGKSHRCRRRAISNTGLTPDDYYCAPHGKQIAGLIAMHNICSSCGKRYPVGGTCCGHK